MTDVPTRNQNVRQLIMMLVDLGLHLEMEEAQVLIRNLLQLCTILGNHEAVKDYSEEEMIGVAELQWTSRLACLTHTLQSEQSTSDVNDRLKFIFGNFNKLHDFKVSTPASFSILD